MKAQSPVRCEHFSRHWLAWLTLRHFLPVRLVRELSAAIVADLSAGGITLEDLFDEELTDGPHFLETWLLLPRNVDSPAAEYLQRLIRAIAWQNDVDAAVDPNDKVISQGMPLTAVAAAFELSRVDLRWPIEQVRKLRIEQQESAKLLFQCIELAVESINNAGALAGLMAVSQGGEWPLSIAMLKHTGDLFADMDLWSQAQRIYAAVEEQSSHPQGDDWQQFVANLSASTVQSRASAIYIVEGPQRSAPYLDQAIARAQQGRSDLLRANADHDAYVTYFRSIGGGLEFRPDRRSAVMDPPLLGKSHSSTDATFAWLHQRTWDAHREFGAILRRQIALGLGTELRTTKAFYARFLIDDLKRTLGRERHVNYFQMAVFCLIESGDHDAPSRVGWDTRLVNAYVDRDSIRQVLIHAERYQGVKQERHMVALELLKGWIELLAPEKTEALDDIMRFITRLALEASASVLVAENLGGRSLEILRNIAEKRPELRQRVTPDVAAIVIARLKIVQVWKAQSAALELAMAYIEVFSRDELKAIVDTTLEALDRINPKAVLWPVVNPALALLTSGPVKGFAGSDTVTGRRVVDAVLKFGIEQDGQQGQLFFNLHNFAPQLLRESSVTSQLQDTIIRVRSGALNANSSAAVGDIQALLLVPSLAKQEGIGDALDGFRKILRSVKSGHPSLSFTSAYWPLMLMANEQNKIAQETNQSMESFRSVLNLILDDLIDLWRHAKSFPLIFAPFSIPQTTVPNATVVHNWTYASMLFAQTLGRSKDLLVGLEIAKAQPALANAIDRAQTVRSLAANEVIDVERIRFENGDTFYAALGARLATISRMPESAAQQVCKALLDQCLRLGPREVDAAVFLMAIQLRLQAYIQACNWRDYFKRASNEEASRTSVLPILNSLDLSIN